MRETLPRDWDDHDAWERHFQHLLDLGGSDEMQWAGGLRFAPILASMGAESIWFPGVGLSEAPAMLTRFGFEVWVTDIAHTAIDFQQHAGENVRQSDALDAQLQEMFPELPPGEGTFHALHHDFRTPFPHNIDCIINIQALQGLTGDSLLQAARVHFDALNEGRVAFFDTFNIFGARRDVLEGALEAAGFFVPFRDAHRWYRAQLRATGIPHALVQDHPRVLKQGPFTHPLKRKRAQHTLDALRAEFEQRHADEWERTHHLWSDGATRVAQVTYHTSGDLT